MIILIMLMLFSLMAGQRRVLGCGLVGFAPNGKKKANLDKIKIMLLYNSTRGTDSCGILINDGIQKGIDGVSDICVWLQRNKLEYNSKGNRAILAHMRKSTHGIKTEDNAHPFIFTNEEGRTIIGAHNGTIENTPGLCTKYGVDDTGLTVDSQRLFKIIIEKGYDVLNDYIGGAALIWTYSDDPGAVYVFKGASRTYKAQEDISDERPLFFLQSDEGTYISSMREPLDTICNQGITIYTPIKNVVCRLIDGEITRVFEAERETVNIPVETFPMGSNYSDYGRQMGWNGGQMVGVDDDEDWYDNEPNYVHKNAIHSVEQKPILKKMFRIKKPMDMYKECSFGNGVGYYVSDGIYFMGGRYYCFPSGIQGVHIPMNLHGIDKCKQARADMSVDKYLVTGWQEIRIMAGFLYEVKKPGHQWNTSGIIKAYFYRGVMIDGKRVDEFIKKQQPLRLDALKQPFERMRQLSAYSMYPVTFSYEEAIALLVAWKDSVLIWYKGGRELRDSAHFQPLFSKRHYHLSSAGKLLCIRTENEADCIYTEDIEDVEYITVDSNVKPKEDVDVYELVSVGEFSVCRMRNINKAIEEMILVDEDFNGIGDTDYFIRYNKTLPTNIENFAINGMEALESAVGNFIEDEMSNIAPEKIEESAKRMIQIASEGDGVIVYMKRMHRCDIMGLLQDVLTDWCEDIETEAQDELDDAITTKNLVSNLMTSMNGKVKLGGDLSHKKSKDEDVLSEEDWQANRELSNWQMGLKLIIEDKKDGDGDGD